uniref:hypothetical protein n=1 Tax=Sphingomonas sp. TaxID=28214 RepID=UPI0035B1B8EB
RALYGPSAGLAISELSLGRTLLGLKRPSEALAVLDEAEPMMRQYLGPVSQGMVMLELSRAPALAALGRQGEAEKALVAAQPGLQVAGRNSVLSLAYLTAHAIVRLKQGRFEESGADLDAAEKLGKALGGQAAPFVAIIAPIRAQLAAAQAS